MCMNTRFMDRNTRQVTFNISAIAKENREEAYILRPSSERKRIILEAMGNNDMTPRMVAMKLGVSDMNYVRPRMTEMERAGILKIVGKAYDEITERNVSLYRRVR